MEILGVKISKVQFVLFSLNILMIILCLFLPYRIEKWSTYYGTAESKTEIRCKTFGKEEYTSYLNGETVISDTLDTAKEQSVVPGIAVLIAAVQIFILIILIRGNIYNERIHRICYLVPLLPIVAFYIINSGNDRALEEISSNYSHSMPASVSIVIISSVCFILSWFDDSYTH